MGETDPATQLLKKPVLTAKEVGTVLRWSMPRVYGAIEVGKIPIIGKRDGSAYRISTRKLKKQFGL